MGSFELALDPCQCVLNKAKSKLRTPVAIDIQQIVLMSFCPQCV